jgi:hypothetical protein
MIVINDEFSIQNTPQCWTLHQNYLSKPKDGTEPKMTSKRTYHATLRQACGALIDQSLDDCSRARSILRKMDVLLEELIAYAEKGE